MSASDAEVAVTAAEAGAQVVRERYGARLVRHRKLGRDFATDADIDAEIAIRTVVGAARPADGFVGEELGASGGSTRRWLVDPLCGTLNFAAQTPLVAVNVCLYDGDRARAAAMVDPLAGETFWTDGSVARLRTSAGETDLVPSAASDLVELNVDAAPELQPVLTTRLLAAPAFWRRFSPRVLSTTLGLAWLAAGRRAAYVTGGDVRDSVHMAAGVAVCDAAGCVVTDLAGHPVYSGADGMLAAADAPTHTALLELIASAR